MRVPAVLLRAALVTGLWCACLACSPGSVNYQGKSCKAGESCPDGLVCDPGTLRCAQPPDGGGEEPLLLDAFCAAFHYSLGSSHARCYGGAPEAWRTRLERSSERRCNQMREAITAGSATLLETEAPFVLSAQADLPCRGHRESVLWEVEARKAVVGSGPLGAPCRSDFACQAGLFCAGLDTACPGSCSAYGVGGSGCKSDTDCAFASQCYNGGCAALPVENERCPGFRCLDGLFCNPNGYCSPRAESGTCATSEQCARTHYCDVAPGRLPECRLRVAPPGSCPLPDSCESLSSCSAGLCTAWNTAGGRCGPTAEGTLDCLQGSCIQFSPSDYRCVAYGASGSTCAEGNPACDPATSQCNGSYCMPTCFMQAR